MMEMWPKPGPATRRLRFRGWARLRAWAGGYFWIPCPLCGQMFGGHETSGLAVYDSYHDGVWQGSVVCRAHDPQRPESPDVPR